MNNYDLIVKKDSLPVEVGCKEFSTFEVDGQLLGINVLDVQDVLNPMAIAAVPMAGSEIAGLLNLRGRIVTAIDMRQKLGLSNFPDRSKCMSIVVEKDQELYSLIVDKVGDVISIPNSQFEQNPPNLKSVWADLASGVYRLDERIMLVVDINNLLSYNTTTY